MLEKTLQININSVWLSFLTGLPEASFCYIAIIVCFLKCTHERDLVALAPAIKLAASAIPLQQHPFGGGYSRWDAFIIKRNYF
jgi:hypothetical protein